MSKAEHRNLPTPPWFKNAPHPGYCRWCSLPVRDKDGNLIRRRTWHQSCADEYMLLKTPDLMRRKVWERDLGICSRCGKRCSNKEEGAEAWQMDHITPLADAPQDPWYWGMDNIQTLCVPCHEWKTTEENASRKRGRTSGSKSRGQGLPQSLGSELPSGRTRERRITDSSKRPKRKVKKNAA